MSVAQTQGGVLNPPLTFVIDTTKYATINIFRGPVLIKYFCANLDAISQVREAGQVLHLQPDPEGGGAHPGD